jgi:outer membrane receptor protein involved in Fe transport
MTTKRIRRVHALLAAGAAAPLLVGASAHAQTATSALVAKNSTNVSEIVVTATRREQALSKVPESVSAFTAKKMDIQGIKTFADVSKFTPGVTFDQDSHDISIRGIESTAGSSTTGIYIDDTPVQVRNLGLNANNTEPVVFDLDRVEVLRGPQGTLFGAGSEGGTVRYITNQPSLTSYSANFRAEGDYTEGGGPSYELGAAGGGPIVENKLGFRISVYDRHDGGYVDRVDYQTLGPTDRNANWVDTLALRAALAWAPIDSVKVTASVDFQNRQQNNYDNYWVGISNPGAGSFLNGTPDPMPDKDKFLMPALKIEWDGSDVTFISNTSYYARKELVGGYSGTLYNLSYFQHFLTGDPNQQSVWGEPALPAADGNGNPIPCANNCGSLYPLLTPTGPNAATLGSFANYYARNTITNSQYNWTQEFRLQSSKPDSRLQWVVGGFGAFNYQRSTEEINDPELPALTQYLWGTDMLTAWGENLLPNGDDYINNTSAHDRQIALFGDATYAILPTVKFEVGLRFAWTHFDYMNLNDGPQDLLCSSGGDGSGSAEGCTPATASGSKNEKPLTPKFGLTWQVTPDDMLYGTVSKGYRIGGATPPLPAEACGGTFPTQYNSDSVWSYEVGAKGRFFDRSVQASLSAYYISWSNIQQAVYVPLCGIQYTTNVGEAVSKGFDFEGQWNLNSAFELEWTVGYTDAYFSKTAYDSFGDVLANKGDAIGEVGATPVPWTVSVGAQYNFHVFDKDAYVRLDDEFQSKLNKLTIAEDPGTAYYDPGATNNPATNLLNLRTGVTINQINVALFANNVLNTHPQLNLQHQDSATLLYEAETFRPLTIGLEVNLKY